MKNLENALKTILVFIITLSALSATAGNEGRGGANQAKYKGKTILLDHLEYLTTRQLEYKDVEADFPEVAKRTKEFKDKNLLYDLGAVMNTSPARNKRWEFSELPLLEDSEQCRNALVYKVDDVGVVACQDSAYVRISLAGLFKMPLEDQNWTINHELLVGILMGRHLKEAEIKKIEPVLRAVNGYMMARVNNQPRVWNKFMLADFKRVTDVRLYTQEEVETARGPIVFAAGAFCESMSELINNPAPTNYLSEADYRLQFNQTMSQWKHEISSLDSDQKKLPGYTDAIDNKYLPIHAELLKRRDASALYEKSIVPQIKSTESLINQLSVSHNSGFLSIQLSGELGLDLQKMYEGYRIQLTSEEVVLSPYDIDRNALKFIQEKWAILNASKLSCVTR